MSKKKLIMKKISIFLSLLLVNLINACQTTPTVITTPSASSSAIANLPAPIPSPTPTANPNGSIGMTVETPKVGSVIDTNFTNSLWLKPVLGTKLVYRTNLNGSNLPGDIIFSVTKADATTFTVNISVFDVSADKSVEYAKLGEFFANPNSVTVTERIDFSTKYDGQENIVVPASSYPGAYKITQSYKEKDSLGKINSTVRRQWYVRGIGVVKTEEIITLESGVSNTTITELKELKLKA